MATEDLRTAIDELEKLNIDDAIADDLEPPAPMPNFPLPRELRDHIFSYLLRHEHVRTEPYHTRKPSARSELAKEAMRDSSSAHTFKFQTNILATNQQIHEETSLVLKSNNFVVVCYRRPDLAKIKHHLGVPIVTESHSHVARFKKHALRVHFHSPPDTKGRGSLSVESFLMVAQDLPSLSISIRYLHTLIPSPAARIAYSANEPACNYTHLQPPNVSIKSVPTLKIRLEIDKEMQIGRNIEQTLLELFRTVVYGLQKINVQNICEDLTEYSLDLATNMGPRTIWITALAWEFYELVRDIKRQADDLVRAGNFTQAKARYHAILLWSTACEIFHLERSMYNADVVWIVSRIDAMVVSSAFCENALNIADESFKADEAWGIAQLASNNLNHAMDMPTDQRGLPAAIILLHEWNIVLTRFFVIRRMDSLDLAVNSMAAIIERSKRELHPFEAGIADFFRHDLARILDHKARGDLQVVYFSKDPKTLKMLCRCFSPSKLGIPLIQSQKVAERPEHMNGLVDRKHYEKLLAIDPEKAAALL